MRPRRVLAAAAAALAACAGHAHAFSTTLYGGAAEEIMPGTPGATTMELQPWLTTIDPDAVCNDGSPAGFYFKKGTASDSWLIMLEGGYWCWDAASCNERFSTLHFDMSSEHYGPLFAQEGIFGSDASTNPFADWNLAFVKYCSSDSWFGDAPASEATFNYSFRGARIIAATVNALISQQGMGLSGGREQLLFGGCSAGGRGALAALDYVAAQAPPLLSVQGFFDAAAWVDIQPQLPGLLTLQQMTADIAGFVQPPVPADCAAAFPGAELWKCLWGSYRLPFIRTPYFVNDAQFDVFQIDYDMDNQPPTTPAQVAFVDEFQSATLAMFATLPRATTGVFSSTCLTHCLSSNSDWWNYTVDGVSLSAAVTAWQKGTGLLGVSGVPVNVISSCQGFACTDACGGGPWQPYNIEAQLEPGQQPGVSTYKNTWATSASTAPAPAGATRKLRALGGAATHAQRGGWWGRRRAE